MVILVGFAALIVVGSYMYWAADGRPGSPAGFRDRVARTGLDVQWENNGNRGGTGIVLTDCGERRVTVSLFDDTDSLWMTPHDPESGSIPPDPVRFDLTADSARGFLACEIP